LGRSTSFAEANFSMLALLRLEHEGVAGANGREATYQMNDWTFTQQAVPALARRGERFTLPYHVALRLRSILCGQKHGVSPSFGPRFSVVSAELSACLAAVFGQFAGCFPPVSASYSHAFPAVPAPSASLARGKGTASWNLSGSAGHMPQ
jgi:hypothetical protein